MNSLCTMTLAFLFCLVPTAALAQDGSADAVTSNAEEERSFYTHRLAIEVDEEVVAASGGKEGLRLRVNVKSREHIVHYKDLELQVMVSGFYGGPKKRLRGRKARMVLNRSESFELEANGSYQFTSPLMESGRGQPDHPHHGVFYEGYLVVVKDKFGIVVASDSNFKPLNDRYSELRGVGEGEDFKAHVLINQ